MNLRSHSIDKLNYYDRRIVHQEAHYYYASGCSTV
jgi:hypothetical protein